MNAEEIPVLRRQATWADWEKGRALRRAVCDRITGGRELRRENGDPRKDVLLRQLNDGSRGARFATMEMLKETAANQP